MKKQHVLALSLALVMSGAVLTGCQDSEESSPAPTETAVTTATPTTEPTQAETEPATTQQPEESFQSIGTPAQGEGIYAIELTNATDAAITAITISIGGSQDYSANMLEEDDPFAAEETRILYYDTTQDAAEDGEEPDYTLTLTMEGDMVAELHAFPFADMTSGKICYDADEGVAYLVYTSEETDEEVNTHQDEIDYWRALAEEEEQARQAEQEQQQAEQEQQQAEQEQQQQVQQEQQQQVQQEQQVQQQEQTPVEETPVEEVVPATQAPAAEETPADPNDGCIGDEGLFY